MCRISCIATNSMMLCGVQRINRTVTSNDCLALILFSLFLQEYHRITNGYFYLLKDCCLAHFCTSVCVPFFLILMFLDFIYSYASV